MLIARDDDDIKGKCQLEHVLLGHGTTFRVHPYHGREDCCRSFCENSVWDMLSNTRMRCRIIPTLPIEHTLPYR
jgi:hypothetical protein